jgi:hypothetical protein
LDQCTGLPGGRKWIQDGNGESGYSFGGLGTPREEAPPSFLRKKSRDRSFSLSSKPWGSKSKTTDSYFGSQDNEREADLWDSPDGSSSTAVPTPTTQFEGFDTVFESDFGSQDNMNHRPQSKSVSLAPNRNSSFFSQGTGGIHSRSLSTPIPQHSLNHPLASNPFSNPSTTLIDTDSNDNFYDTQRYDAQRAVSPRSMASPRFVHPSTFNEGVGRALALYSFEAKQPGDLSFQKGDIITITKKSESTDDWWTGKLNGASGIFPANFVEVL